MNVLVYIVLCAELATLIVALSYVKKHKQKYFKYFVAYAAVIFIVEYIANMVVTKDNGYIYDIYTFFEFNLVAIIFSSTLLVIIFLNSTSKNNIKKIFFLNS